SWQAGVRAHAGGYRRHETAVGVVAEQAEGRRGCAWRHCGPRRAPRLELHPPLVRCPWHAGTARQSAGIDAAIPRQRPSIAARNTIADKQVPRFVDYPYLMDGTFICRLFVWWMEALLVLFLTIS